jgi:ABC-type histidine transport system ATPase subunit
VQQRVAIARALANKPRVILADEPAATSTADNVAGWAHRRLAMRDGQIAERDDTAWQAPAGPPAPPV